MTDLPIASALPAATASTATAASRKGSAANPSSTPEFGTVLEQQRASVDDADDQAGDAVSPAAGSATAGDRRIRSVHHDDPVDQAPLSMAGLPAALQAALHPAVTHQDAVNAEHAIPNGGLARGPEHGVGRRASLHQGESRGQSAAESTSRPVGSGDPTSEAPLGAGSADTVRSPSTPHASAAMSANTAHRAADELPSNEPSANPGLVDSGLASAFGPGPAALSISAEPALLQASRSADADVVDTDQATGLAVAAASASAANSTGPTGNPAVSHALSVSTAIGQPGWTHEFASTLNLAIRSGQQSAEIRVNPESLGPISVNLTLHNGQIALVLGAASGETRQLLESQLSQLTDALGAQGVSVADAQVQNGFSGQLPSGSGDSQGSGQQASAFPAARTDAPGGGLTDAPSSQTLPAGLSTRLVDIFA